MCMVVCLYVFVSGHGCFKSEPIRTKVGMEYQNITGDDLSDLSRHHMGPTLFPGLTVDESIHALPIQTKFIIIPRNITGEVLGVVYIFYITLGVKTRDQNQFPVVKTRIEATFMAKVA
jgi:hypothetical protein